MRQFVEFLVLVICAAMTASKVNAAGVMLAPEVIGEISPTAVTLPAGGPGYYPAMYVSGDTRESGAPTRIAMEFSLSQISSAGDLSSAIFSATPFGGARRSGLLQYSLFGYAGSGTLELTSGAGGQLLAGPFEYDIDFSRMANLSNIDVTDFVRAMVVAGETHAGFVFRDVNTPPNFATDRQLIVVQDSPFWGGDVPPSLSLQIVPEPSRTLFLLFAATSCGLLRKRKFLPS